MFYGGLVVLALVLFVGVPAFLYFYHAPTCTDGTLNGDEVGIDCGGSCPRLCQSAFLPATIPWVKYERVADGLYNIAAYVVNPNTSGAVLDVPYRFTLFDKEGVYITETTGSMTIPAHRNALAFLGAVSVGKRTPARAIFEFTRAPYWQKSHDTLGDITIKDKKYDEDDSGSSLEVTLENRSLTSIGNISVFAVLYDEEGNAIGFSRTHIDEITPGGREVAPFTWPVSRKGRVTSIEILPVDVPTIDRAGVGE